jgi:hypothetical protein
VAKDRDERRISGKDVAATTAIGSATRYAASRHRKGDTTGTAALTGAGASARSTRTSAGRSHLLTVILVVILTVGMLALMLFLGR